MIFFHKLVVVILIVCYYRVIIELSTSNGDIMIIFLSCGRFTVSNNNGTPTLHTTSQVQMDNFINHYFHNGIVIVDDNGYHVSINADVLLSALNNVIDEIDYTAFKATAYRFNDAENYHEELLDVWGAFLR